MSFELTIRLVSFMSFMNIIFNLFLEFFIIVFTDDIFVYTKHKEENEGNLHIILGVLEEKKLYAEFSKCYFWMSFISLGHVVRVMVDPYKIETVRKEASPITMIKS